MFYMRQLIILAVLFFCLGELRAQTIINTTPTGDELGLVTRNIPSGTYTTGSEVSAGTASTATDVLNRLGGVRDDATSTLSDPEGDWVFLRVNARGAMWVSLETALASTIDSITNHPVPNTPFRRVSTGDTNIANVKASAGVLRGVQASNVNAAARYLHLYNTAGSPTCNTGIIQTYIIPGSTSGAGTNIPHLNINFATGIGICITTAVDGTGAVAANEIVINIQHN